jgi:hypothetical protein
MLNNDSVTEAQTIISLATTLLQITQNDEKNYELIESARNKFETRQIPAIQLYGVSQAGKSTLISCLTLGEQYIPVGTGKATTAVKIELLNVSSSDEHRAEIEWFNPKEILKLVEQPLEFFIKNIKGNKDYQKSLFLSKEDRDFLWDILQIAKNARKDDAVEASVGGGNDLAIAEAILIHYEEYMRMFNPKGYTIYNFSKIPDITRQPHEWGSWEKRDIREYEFNELRSFFTKKVRLYVSTSRIVKDLRLLDTPGFGVSNLHDEICRTAQKEAEAIILVLGTQFTTDQLREIKQLTLGLYDNLFVIWNPKEHAKEHSQETLEDMLIKLREETGISVPKSRAVVANLHLALRAMQWAKISKGNNLSTSTVESLHEMFSRKYKPNYSQDENGIKKYIKKELRRALEIFIDPEDDISLEGEDKIAEMLQCSGWDNVIELINNITKSQEQRRKTEFATKILSAMIFHLESFPTPREENVRQETLKGLKLMLASIEKKRGLIKEEMLKNLDEKDNSIFDEFLSYLVEDRAIDSLKSSIRDKINSEIHFSTVAGKIESLVKDYVNARCSVWTKGITGFTTDVSQEWILSSYKEAVSNFEEWISSHQLSTNPDIASNVQSQITLRELLRLEFSSAPQPKIDLSNFDESLQIWVGKMTSSTFSPNWVNQFLTWVAEIGSEVDYQFRRLGNWLSSLNSKTKKETEKKPSFDKSKALQSSKEKINAFLSKNTFEKIYKLGQDPSLLQLSTDPSNLNSQDFITWAKEIERQVEIYNQKTLLDRCDEFCRSWRIGKDNIKLAANESFTCWAKQVQSSLQERYDRLNSESKRLIEQSSLEDMEKLVNELQILINANEKSFHNELSKAKRLIDDRKQ